MKLLLDEMHAAAVAVELRSRGVDAIAITEHPELRGTDDAPLLAWAAAEQRVVVTENVRDFAPIAAGWSQRQQPHPGFVFTNRDRFHRASKGYVGTLTRALEALDASGWPSAPSEVTWL